jgi:DNA-binding response OmpR family regulator
MPYKVLFIDGDPDSIAGLAKNLKSIGFETAVTTGVPGALEQAGKFSPDLIFLNLPGKDSLALLTALKAAANKIPVVMLTAENDNESRQQAVALGAQGVWTKPFIIKKIIEQLTVILKSGSPPKPSGRQRVLVIDDAEVILEFIKITFTTQGFDVITCTDGQSALLAVQIYDPHLIILDLTMPGLTGWKFTQMLRQDPEFAAYAQIPIIILSGLISEPAVSDSPLQGDYYMPKPFEIPVLLAKAKELLKNKGA